MEEIEKNYKYLSFHSSCVSFIASFVQKPEQFTLQAANETLGKLHSTYMNVLEHLAKPVSVSQRLDMKSKDVWQKYKIEREKMKEIRNVLWEIEAKEEKVAELDDWREEPEHFTSPDLKILCGKIDDQNRKISRYEKRDVRNNWKTVERDLKKLQLLRVKVRTVRSNFLHYHLLICCYLHKRLIPVESLQDGSAPLETNKSQY